LAETTTFLGKNPQATSISGPGHVQGFTAGQTPFMVPAGQAVFNVPIFATPAAITGSFTVGHVTQVPLLQELKKSLQLAQFAATVHLGVVTMPNCPHPPKMAHASAAFTSTAR